MPKSKDCLQDKDFLQYVPTKFQQNRKTMLKKRNRRKSYHQRLARLKNIGGYPEPVQYVDKYYCGFYEIPRKKPYYKRLYISNWDDYRFHKRLSNKKVRRVLDVSSRGGYKKVLDLWWETL